MHTSYLSEDIIAHHRGIRSHGDAAVSFKPIGKISFRRSSLILVFAPNISFRITCTLAKWRIAAALAHPIDRALHHFRASLHGNDGIRHRHLAVVVRMDAEPHFRQGHAQIRNDLLHLVRQGAAIGVAQIDDQRARLVRGPQDRQRVFRIPLVAVEKVLRVK